MVVGTKQRQGNLENLTGSIWWLLRESILPFNALLTPSGRSQDAQRSAAAALLDSFSELRQRQDGGLNAGNVLQAQDAWHYRAFSTLYPLP